jgi:hypothetical protein
MVFYQESVAGRRGCVRQTIPDTSLPAFLPHSILPKQVQCTQIRTEDDVADCSTTVISICTLDADECFGRQERKTNKQTP